MKHNRLGNRNTIEMNYKFLARWYLTPERMHKYQPDKCPQFWRDCKQRAVMTHIWWECPKIKDYRQEINYIEEITGEKIVNNLQTCLFHDSNITKMQYRKTLTPIL